MTRKRKSGYIFETFKGDHPPLHVHIYRGKQEVGRWDIENQRPMDDFELTRRLRDALRALGYLLEKERGERHWEPHD